MTRVVINKVALLLIIIHASHTENIYSSDIKSENAENKSDIGKVTIYTEANFWGIPWVMTLTSNCSDVPAYFYKKTSSIDSHNNCVILFSRQQCQGRHVKIEPGTNGHSHLNDVNFDESMASLKPCDKNDKSQYSGPSVKSRNRRQVPGVLTYLAKRSETLQLNENADDGNSNQDSQEETNEFNVLKSPFQTSKTSK